MLTSAQRSRNTAVEALGVTDAADHGAESAALEEFLLSQGLVSEQVIGISLQLHRSTGIRLSSILVASGALSPEALAVVMRHPLQLPYVDLDDVPADDGAYELVPADFAASHDAVPFACNPVGRVLRVAFEQPTERVIAHFERVFAVTVVAHRSDRDKIKDYAFRLYNPLISKRLAATRQQLYNEHTRIGVTLAARGLVDPKAFGHAISLQLSTGYRFGALLGASGSLHPQGERELLATPIPCPYITLSHVRVDEEARAMIDDAVAIRYRCAPLLRASGLLYVAFALTPTERVLRELDQISGVCVSPFLASRLEVLQFIGRLYPQTAPQLEAEVRSLVQSGRTAQAPAQRGWAASEVIDEVPSSRAPDQASDEASDHPTDQASDQTGEETTGDAAQHEKPEPEAGGPVRGIATTRTLKKSEGKKRPPRRRYGHYQ